MMKQQEKQPMMKRTISLIPLLLLISVMSFGQLTGIKTVPGDYRDIATAISALNSNGVGEGGVFFDIDAGHVTSFVNLTDGLITATGTATTPIVFRKSGTGVNPLITAAAGGTGNYDYIICLAGSDYITFDGIDVEDNPLNTTATTRMEFGYAFFKTSGTDGAQHNTLKNGSISLLYNTNAYGITLDNRLWSNPGVAGPAVTAVSGTNSWNDFRNLTFNNCYGGINLAGFASAAPFDFYDQGNTIGVNGGNTFSYTAMAGTTVNSYGINGIYQNGLVIANNTFTGSLSMTTGRYYAMNLLDSENADLDIFNNTLSINCTGSGHFYGFYVNGMGMNGTTNSVNFYNNQFINNTFTTHTSGNVVYAYITTGAVHANCYNNMVSNNAIGSATANSTGIVYYMWFRSDPLNKSGSMNHHDNTISNNTRNTIATTITSSTMLYHITGSTDTLNVYDNLLDNNTVYAGNTYCFNVIHIGRIKNIHHNTIKNISGKSGTLYGIYNANGSVRTDYHGNLIQNLTTLGNPNTSGPTQATVQGIYLQTGFNTFLYNNFICQLYSPNSILPNAVRGITVGGLNNNLIGLYNNTIYLDGTSTVSGFGTSGILAEAGATKLDMRNNIIVNNALPTGTGLSVAYRRSNTLLSTYEMTSNYNLFYINESSPNNRIFFDGTNSFQTLQEYKAFVDPRDAQSVSEMPPFINVATSPYDLHLMVNTLTNCESGGKTVSSPISISNDFDDQSRYPNPGYPNDPLAPASAPDIGADEFAGLYVDILGPAIEFTPLSNTSATGSRVIQAFITDPAGVPVSGDGLPVLFWRINSGTWNAVTAIHTGGDMYSFTFGAGVIKNDTIYYYVVAQDMKATPNVAVKPSYGAAGLSFNPPACATAPLQPYAYRIVGIMSGLYTVGAGQNYSTLSAAVADLNDREVVGPVTFELWDAQYTAPSETFPITINNYLGASQTNTVTIQPKPGVNPTITGNSLNGIIRLNGCRYVTIFGSDNSKSGRNLTLKNTSDQHASFVVGLFNNESSGASLCTIRGCKISSTSQLSNSTYGIYLDPFLGGYDQIVIDNNEIFSARIGINLAGQWNKQATNCQITNNVIGSTTLADEVKNQGIYLIDATGTHLKGNEIIGASAGNTGQAGIYLATGVENTVIEGNIIHRLQTSASNSNCTGINVATTSAETPTKIINNLIYNIKAGAYPSGINISSAGNVSVQHNSISLTDTTFLTTNATTHYSACLVAGSSSTNLDIRNNIFRNTQQCVNAANVNPKTYAVYSSAAASAYAFIDNNDYFVNDVTPASGLAGRIGYLGSARNTLADWQSATGQDPASQNVDPQFPAYGNLHATAPALNNAGVAIPAVPTDFNGNVRTDPPDVGAYEFILPIAAMTTLDATGIGMDAATLNGELNSAGEMVNLFFEYGETTAYGNTIAGVPSPVRSLTATAFSADVSGLQPGMLYHYRAKGVSATSNETVYGAGLTFMTLPAVPVNATLQNIAITNGQDTCFDAQQTITVAGDGTTFTIENGASAILVAGQNIIILPGTTVAEGGYMHGQITETNEFCSGDAPVASVKAGMEEIAKGSAKQPFRIYPNPTTGTFTLELTGTAAPTEASLEIYGIRGEKVLQTDLFGLNRHTISLGGQPTGLYFIRLVSDGKSVTGKIIKN